jgi:hypothetical protein
VCVWGEEASVCGGEGEWGVVGVVWDRGKEGGAEVTEGRQTEGADC